MIDISGVSGPVIHPFKYYSRIGAVVIVILQVYPYPIVPGEILTIE
jgi:hypothetical protein